MLADCFPIEFNAGRRETPRPDGSRIVFIPGKPNRWLAINAMGVRIGGDYSSESLAQSALNDQIVSAPEPPKRARCSHCRSGYHTVADCPVKAAEGERIAAARKAKDMATSTVQQPVKVHPSDADYLSAVRKSGDSSGVTVDDVRAAVYPHNTIDTRRALDRLTAAGKLTRTVNGKKAARYRVRIRPEIIRAMFTSEDADLPDVPAPNGSRVLVVEDPPTPPEILDPDVLRPEEPTECGPLCEDFTDKYAERPAWLPDVRHPEEDAPYVCPGCHAVGEAPCSPTSGCPEAEIVADSSPSLLDEVLGPLEDDDDPDAPNPWDSWLPDVRQSATDVSTTPIALTPIRAQQIIRREQRLRFTRAERAAELREAVRVLRALADVGEGLIAEVGR